MDENAKSCPACGAAVESTQDSNESNEQDKVKAAFEKINDTADTTADYDSKDIDDNKVMGVLAYIGILFLIPLLAAPNSKFARFHTNQGLILFIADVVLGAAAKLVSFIPVVGWVISIAVGVVGLAFMILGIVNAANGKAKELPLIGNFKLLK